MKFKGIGFITVEPEQLQLPMDLGQQNLLAAPSPKTMTTDTWIDFDNIQAKLDVLLKEQAAQAQAIALVQHTLSAIIEKVGLV